MKKNNEKIRILTDLKPAFDGYGGIPQETRLMFSALRSLSDPFEIEGLIQHGSRRLRPGLSSKRNALPTARRVNRLSRMVVSVYKTPYGSWSDHIGEFFDRYLKDALALAGLRARALTGASIKPTIFQSDLFDDFVWRTFFSKTLRPEDKETVTGARFQVLRNPKKLFHKAGLSGLKYSQTPRYPSIDTSAFDFFVAETPYPARVSWRTKLVVRYHDAVPVLMPHTIDDKAFHQASHFYSLQDNVNAGGLFVCVSEATRADLLKIFPEVEPRTSVIHNIVSPEYFEENSPRRLTTQIIRARLADVQEFSTNVTGLQLESGPRDSQFNFILMVSTIEPRKNHALLLRAWERLKYTSLPGLKLVIVGNPGWDYQSTLKSFRPWAERGDLFYLNNVPPEELRVLYRHASVTVCPSLAEGFDYSGVEAMASGGVVVASDIAVHREVFGNAADYFSPYSQEDAATVIHQAITATREDQRRLMLLQQSREVSARYTQDRILPQWAEFFTRNAPGTSA